MTYQLSLSTISLFTGAVLAASSIPGLVKPKAARKFILALPRNYTAGVLLMISSLGWSIWLLTSVLDLGEFSHHRNNIITFVVLLAVLTVIFLPDYLSCRAWGIFLLLATEILLSACFTVETTWKWPVVTIAYGWATSGLIFVSTPYTLRNLLERWNSNEKMTRISSAINFLIGSSLLIFSQTVYHGL